MSKIDDGGQAFPSEGEGHGTPQYHSPGMTLRDWFAGQALAGMLAAGAAVDIAGTRLAEKRAGAAYAIADAMLAARAAEKEEAA